MKLQFKYQQFQADAAKAVVDVFDGQPNNNSGNNFKLTSIDDLKVWSNAQLVPEMTDGLILEQIQKIQRSNGIEPSKKLEGKYNLTVEMETGVGKTYTYIKTMYELNKHYGWTKFIVVVPSIAIREGVYKTFEMTQEHFAEEYGKKIRFFIYNSARLDMIDQFASDSSINAMIINSQAFNAKGKDARRIDMQLDNFRSRKPIDVIAKTNPILIIDEPQSVEGKQTKENLKKFNPMITLRYSATHKSDSIYNMIYRLDAMDAYNKRLVKKISVKGITESSATATAGFVYLASINLSKDNPTATIQFDFKGKSSICKKIQVVNIGFNLYENSNYLDEYKDGFVVKSIDGRDDSVEFINGVKIYAGDVIGNVTEEQLRRIQIHETILSHIERERQLFSKGIKVLSLFFIDEVEHYKRYDESGKPYNGIFADMFEEEYQNVIDTMPDEFFSVDYKNYLASIPVNRTHAGYFSIDKKNGRMTNSKLSDKKSRTSDDIDAYDLIMKNKELLLDNNPKKSPVRFIFSHSALREGWDNPNVFQICTLKSSGSEIRKRQEVGRGLRLCVNQNGERQDIAVLGKDVHSVNILTVIAGESYDSFAKNLQKEIAESISDRPLTVTTDLFLNRTLKDSAGNELLIDNNIANKIYKRLIKHDYLDDNDTLKDKYYQDKADGNFELTAEFTDYTASIIKILDSVYDNKSLIPENARSNNVELTCDKEKLYSKEFQELWSRINGKSVYFVNFDTAELVKRAITTLNQKLHVTKIFFKIERGQMDDIKSKADLLSGESFVLQDNGVKTIDNEISVNRGVKYDLVGKLVEATGLTRKTIIQILKGLNTDIFNKFQNNPEEFILKAAELINDEKAVTVVAHITYNAINDRYDTDIFTEPIIKGKLNSNAVKVNRHLYDYLIYDSTNEKIFANKLDTATEVAVYVKLPRGFYISTPLGRYNPDWAIAFYEGIVKHIYFVAETKADMNPSQLRLSEQSKIDCAKEHFKAICGDNVIYDVIDSYETLLNKVMK